MAKFQIEVDGKIYDMEYNRDSVRQFEAANGTPEMLTKQYQSAADRLFVIGIMTDNTQINKNLAAKIREKAYDEYGLATVYSTLIDPFVEVFTQAGTQPGKKSMLANQTAEDETDSLQ